MTSTVRHRICFEKGNEIYRFTYDRQSVGALLNIFGQYASNPELAFSWYDPTYLSNCVRVRHQPVTN